MRRLERGLPGPGRTISCRSADAASWLKCWPAGSLIVSAAGGLVDGWVRDSTTSAAGALRIDDLRVTVAIIFLHPIGVRVQQRSLSMPLPQGLTIW